MGTINCIIKKKLPLHHELTDDEKEAILEENKDINVSYKCLIKEMFTYTTYVDDLLKGWGGVKLFKI